MLRRLALPLLLIAACAPAARAAVPADLGAWDGVGGFRPVAAAGPYVAGTKVIAVSPDEFGHAARWTGGTLTDLTAIGGAGSQRSSAAYDVSASGLVVGTSNTGDAFAGESAFKGTSPSLVDLGVLDDAVFLPAATARGVNAQGVIVGSSMRGVGATEREQGFRLASGVLGPAAAIPAGAGDAANDVHLLAISDAPATRAVGVRNWVEQTGGGSGIVVDGTTITALPFVPGRHGISTDGALAAGTTGAGGARRLDLATPGATAQVLAPLAPATTAAASAVAASGLVVGSSGGHAVAWEGGAAIDLNGLLDAGTGWVLEAALDVTDDGLVLGYGTLNGVRHGFLLPFTATGIVVNASGDQRDANPATQDGICDADAGTAGLQCTLRAAIETANEPGGDDRITFDLPAGAAIRPSSPLPALAAADASIDGDDAVRIDGSSLLAGRAALALRGARTTARGLVIGPAQVGVELAGARSVVEGSRIGVAANGAALPIAGNGVVVLGSATGARVGGLGAGQAVTIANTGGAGVGNAAATGVSVRGDRITATGGLAIDVAGEGPTENPAPGAAAGPTPYPVLVALDGEHLTGLLPGRPSATYAIDLYAGLCGGERGQLERHLRTFTVDTDPQGIARIDVEVPAASGLVVATATDAAGGTSEPSAARLAASDPADGRAPARSAAARAPAAPCGTDFRIVAIEPVQRVQSEVWATLGLDADALPGLTGSRLPIAQRGLYGLASNPVRLVRGVSTFAKVFLRDEAPGGSSSTEVPRVILYGFVRRGERLVQLTPRLVAAERAPLLGGGPRLSIESARRGNLGHLFRLPDAWTRSREPVILVAGANIDNAVPECDGDACRANNWYELDGLDFAPTGSHPVELLRATWPGRRRAAADDAAWLKDVERTMLEYLPLAPDRSPVTQSAAVVDIARDIQVVQLLANIPPTGNLRACWANETCQNALPMQLAARAARMRTPGGAWPLLAVEAGPSQAFSVTTGYGPSDATWAALDFERNGDNVALLAHELGHSIGDLRHVVGCGGAGPDLRYPDGSGLLASWAFIPPARAGEPGRTIGPTDAHDVMTYCDQRDARRRMSRYSWDAFVRHVVVAGPGLAPAPRTAARRTLRVLVLAAQGGRAVATVVPSTDAPTGVPTGATATLVARDAAGAVVLSRPLALVADGAAGGAAAVRVAEAVIPAAHVASVAVEEGGRLLATVARGRGSLSVRLPGPAPRVRRGRPTVVRVSLDGPVADATLEVSTDGRRFTPLVAGLHAGRVVLAPDVLPQGRRLRLRIVATDGFRTASATSRPFAAPGARPRVTITSPGTGGVYARGARIELVGRAVLRAGGVVPGRRLRWLDGRRQLGRGARLATTRLARGRHVLTLVATAGPGLVGRARVTIRVR